MRISAEDKEAAFKAAYAALNAAQKEAVDTIEGPVMVVAGPGTGKTQILTLRIANILLKTDTAPDSILALTFTESGAKAMRERLRSYIGSTAYKVPIYTFHGFAQRLIAEYPDAYTRVIGGQPANDLDKISIIETILAGGDCTQLRPLGDPSYYVTPILRIISQLKQEYITPDRLASLLETQATALLDVEQFHQKGAHKGKVRGEYATLEKSLEKNRELLFVYRQYEALLSDKRLYDFEDMLVETVQAMTNSEDMLRDLQEQYQYLLADEHQDVNGTQNKILELLASFHSTPNIFAVGDEKQAIYRFQGASLENFLYFTEQFPDTKVITLTENYRSGQAILDAAHSLVEVDSGPVKDLRIPLKAVAVKGAAVTSRLFSHQAVEDAWVTEHIANSIAKGRDPSQIAVIVRTNREVEAYSTQLRKAGLPVAASADGDILKHPITTTVRQLVNAVVNHTDTSALFGVLHGAYWEISQADLFTICAAQTYDRSLWTILQSREVLADLKVTNMDACLQVAMTLEEARSREATEAPHRVLEYLLQASGLLDYVITHDPLEGTRVIRRLYDEIESLVVHEGLSTLRSVGTALDTRIAYGLPLTAPYISSDQQAVQVLTAHKAKGLEFEEVYIPHLVDSSWSGLNKKRYFRIPISVHSEGASDEVIEDERRLLYVAMTRARSVLHLSSSETSAEGKEFLPARLLDEVDQTLLSVKDTTELNQRFDPVTLLKQSSPVQQMDTSVILAVLKERGFSATSLNNYLKSPFEYLYRNVLRIPETQSQSLMFGTAIHDTLEYVTKTHCSEGSIPSDTAIKKRLEHNLKKLPLTTVEFTTLLEKGLTALLVYVPYIATTLPVKTAEEFKLQVSLPTGIPELPDVTLVGKLDRLDFDEAGRLLRVVDYKTGTPKSRNVIEGKTKSSEGDYKRQLTFYTLLLSLYDDERYQCKDGVISFVQPTKSGVIKEETFTITGEEIDALKQTIIDVIQEIVSGKSFEQPCDPTKSNYCHLVTALSL